MLRHWIAGGALMLALSIMPAQAQKAVANPPDLWAHAATGVQFPVPAEDLYGYGDVPAVLITDTLKVPASLAKGDYVLSWRWDCEQTPQIWNTCADLTVV